MSDDYRPGAAAGPPQSWPAWRRWQVAGQQLTVHGIVVPVLAVVAAGLSMVSVFSQLYLLLGGASFVFEAILLLLRILLCVGVVVLMVVSFQRAARLRRMFVEVGPHGVVQHDGWTAQRIPWTEIDRLYEPQPGQLGLLLRNGRSVTLAVPTKQTGPVEVQAARHMILGQLGNLDHPPHPPTLR